MGYFVRSDLFYAPIRRYHIIIKLSLILKAIFFEFNRWHLLYRSLLIYFLLNPFIISFVRFRINLEDARDIITVQFRNLLLYFPVIFVNGFGYNSKFFIILYFS